MGRGTPHKYCRGASSVERKGGSWTAASRSPLEVSCELACTTFLPNDPKTAGADEIRFFSQNTPLPPDEIDWTLRAIYHAVIPGFAIEDLGLLAAGLRALHERGFKERALVLRSQNTRDFLNFTLTELGAAVGVSSLGPGVYAIVHEHDQGLRSELVAAGKKWGLPLHSDSPGWNAGHLVSSR